MDNISIGKRLKQYRESAGMRQGQIAAYLDIDKSMVSRIESGEYRMTTEQLHSLAELFSCNEMELLSGTGEIQPMNIAICTVELDDEDMRVIAVINHIATNSCEMAKLLDGYCGVYSDE